VLLCQVLQLEHVLEERALVSDPVKLLVSILLPDLGLAYCLLGLVSCLERKFERERIGKTQADET
jgi:hypothetical protein